MAKVYKCDRCGKLFERRHDFTEVFCKEVDVLPTPYVLPSYITVNIGTQVGFNFNFCSECTRLALVKVLEIQNRGGEL